MVMKALRQGAAGGIFKFIIFGFLLFAVGGMVFMDIGGFFRNGGVSSNDVATVGRESISLPAFDRSLRRSLAQLGIAPQDAYKAGYVDQMLGGEIRARLIEQAGDDLGVLVDRKRVAQKIKTLIGPMVQPGQDPKDVLKQILMSQGMSEGDLSNTIGQQITLDLINDTVAGGFKSVPDPLAKDLYAFENETRDIVFIPFLESDLKDLLPPTDAQLQELYDATKEAYATPETRELQLVTIKSDSLKSTIEIDEQEIRDAYENSIDLYSEKEQRVLEQSILDSEDQAKEVAEKVSSGNSLEKAVKAVTKRETDYLGEKAFELQSIPPEIKEQVLAAKKSGDVIGPLKTSIGWQVIVLKKISPAQTKPFESVKKEIHDELLDTKSIDQQYQLAGTVEDMLAGGATLDDVKKEVDIAVTDLPEVNAYGQGKDGKDGLKNFEKNRNFILENGFQLGQDETSPVSESADGKFIAVHVKSIKPKTYAPFKEVKDGIAKRWVQDQRTAENKLRVMKALDEIKETDPSPEDAAKAHSKSLQSKNNISRKTAPSAPLDARSWANIFEAFPHEPFVLDIQGGSSIAWVTDATLPAKTDVSSKEFKDFKTGLLTATQNEAQLMYGESKRLKYGAKVNKRLLDQAYGGSDDGAN